MNLNFKKQPSFICLAEDFVDALSRIVAITDYGQSTGALKHHVLVTDSNKLYILGISQDVTAYLAIDVESRIDGVCSINATDVIGILKKRKGKFDFSCEKGSLKYSSTTSKYSGQLALKEMSADIDDAANSINISTKGTTLKQELLSELKKAVKSVTLKDAVFGNPLNINIRCSDGNFFASSNDGYHAVVYIGKNEFKAKNFDLSVSGAAYNVIDKFIANQVVSFSISNTLQITNKTSIYAAIPPIQSKDDDFAVFDQIQKMLKDKHETEFTVDSAIFDSIANMSTLKSSALESSTSFAFTQKDGNLKITYKTTSGSTSETLECSSHSGKAQFSIGERMLNDIMSAFSGSKEIRFYVNKNSFIVSTETDDYKLIGAGTLDER